MKLFVSIFIVIVLSGCEMPKIFQPSKEEMALKNKELDAKIHQQKYETDVQKELELAKINSTIEKEKLQLQNQEKQQNYELQKIQYEAQALQQQNILIFAAFIFCVIAVGLFIYFNNRRKDKLRAYEDNLQKYFQSKENEAKVKIAHKMLDTISSGKLSSKQEARLLSSMNQNSEISQKVLEEIEEEPVMELEIIDEKKKKKKKKKSKS